MMTKMILWIREEDEEIGTDEEEEEKKDKKYDIDDEKDVEQSKMILKRKRSKCFKRYRQ